MLLFCWKIFGGLKNKSILREKETFGWKLETKKQSFFFPFQLFSSFSGEFSEGLLII